jgi:hypothetical protein
MSNIGNVVFNEAEQISVLYKETTQGETSFASDTIEFREYGVMVTRDSGGTRFVQFVPYENILAIVQTETL